MVKSRLVKVRRGDRYFYGKTKREAQEKRRQYDRAIEDGIKAEANGTTVKTYVAKWLPIHKGSIGAKTYNYYATLLDVLVDRIGERVLGEVTASDAKSVYAHFHGYADTTIKKARMLYIALFDTAIEDGLCRHNPFRSKHAQPERGPSGSHRAITAEERQAILDYHGPMRTAVLIMLYAGLRRGEVLAIDLDTDFDPKARTLTVSKAIRYDSNQPIVADPKTEAGARTIDLPDILVQELKGKHGLVLHNGRGGYMSSSSFRSAWATFLRQVACQLNGVKQRRWHDEKRDAWKEFSIRPHDLRHSYCTMLRDAGVDLKQAMLWLGHSDEKMILKVYDHVGTERRQKSLKQVQNLLDGGKNGGTAKS